MKRLTILFCLLLSACGGGGGGGGSAPVPVVTPPIVQASCPDGSSVAFDKTDTCPTVTPVAGITFANVDPRKMESGLVVPFNGTLDSTSIDVVLSKGGAPVIGATSLGTNNRVVFIPKKFLAYGQYHKLEISAKDSVGRIVKAEYSFKTIDMICTSAATWSTPALFSSAYQNCVAGIGVQAKVDPVFNMLQDDSCTVTVGAPITPACRDYFANGTMLLADTGVTPSGHPAMWASYIGLDKLSDLVLLDVANPASPVPVGVLSLTSPIIQWEIGNPTGMFIRTADGKGSQITVNPDQTLKVTCVTGCQ